MHSEKSLKISLKLLRNLSKTITESISRDAAELFYSKSTQITLGHSKDTLSRHQEHSKGT